MDVITKLKHDKAYVNGKWIAALSGKTYNVTNPSTGVVITSVPDMNADDTKTAIESAHGAFESWKNVTPHERSKILKKWYELCIQNKNALATIITLEMGKPIAESLGEVMYGSDFLEWFAEESKRIYGDVSPSPFPNKRMIVLKQPIGVAGMIIPWNFPYAMLTRKAAAAIAAGCTVVLKPAEDTPLSALALCHLAEEAGLPPGVLNVVTCDRLNASAVGRELCENPLVSKISFTGSTAVGKILLAQSASTVKKVSLELGGNAPFIVFDSANVDQAVKGFMGSKFRCSGQTCICANRTLVQEGIYDKFIEGLSKAMNTQLTVGDGLNPTTTQGPLINKRAVEKVEDLIKTAIGEGAKVVVGGAPDERGGNFFQPTLLVDVNTSMTIAHREIFGPVASVIKFKTEEEVVTIANATPYGLAGYFYSADIAQAWRVAEKLEYGMVGVNETGISSVNTVFGGWKESGLGTEGARYGIDEYLIKKNICFGGIHQNM